MNAYTNVKNYLFLKNKNNLTKNVKPEQLTENLSLCTLERFF